MNKTFQWMIGLSMLPAFLAGATFEWLCWGFRGGISVARYAFERIAENNE